MELKADGQKEIIAELLNRTFNELIRTAPDALTLDDLHELQHLNNQVATMLQDRVNRAERLQALKYYDLNEWKRDIVLRLDTSLIYAQEVINKLCEGMPPKFLKLNVFQSGEPNSADENGALLYPLFMRNDIEGTPDSWRYVGDRLPLDAE